MEVTEKKVPTTFEKAGARVKRIVEAKHESSRFVFKRMEVINWRTRRTLSLDNQMMKQHGSIYWTTL